AGVAVGPGDQGGVAAGVVGEGGLLDAAVRPEQAGVERGLADVDADEGGRGGAPGVPPLWLMDAGYGRVCRPRDSVRGRRAPAAGPRSGSRGQGLSRCMRLLRPPGLAPTMRVG